MIGNFYRRIICCSGFVAVLAGCQFNQVELMVENLHQGEEVFCAEHHSVISDTPNPSNDSTVFQVNVRALKAPWEAPVQALQEPVKILQTRRPGTKVAVFSIKKNVLRAGLSSYESYPLKNSDLIEGEFFSVGRRKWKVIMIGFDGANVNGKKYCNSEFVYVKEMK